MVLFAESEERFFELRFSEKGHNRPLKRNVKKTGDNDNWPCGTPEISSSKLTSKSAWQNEICGRGALNRSGCSRLNFCKNTLSDNLYQLDEEAEEDEKEHKKDIAEIRSAI